MSSNKVRSKIKGRAILNGSVTHENWVEDWGRITDEFLKKIEMIENLPKQGGTSAEKFKRLIDIKEEYDMEYVPSMLLSEIFLPELQKLKDVQVKLTEDSLVLKADDVFINLKAGFNNGVFCCDTSEYYFPDNRYDKPNTLVETCAKTYTELKKGKIDVSEAQKMIIEKTSEAIGYFSNRNDSDIHEKVLVHLTTDTELYESYITHVNGYEKQLRENMRKEERNELRDERRLAILKVTGLFNLLKSLRKAGLKIHENGLIDGDFEYPELQ